MNAFISAFLLSHRKSITHLRARVPIIPIIQDEQYAARGHRKAGQ